MSESVVAFRYAKSLLDLSQEKGVSKEVNENMGFFKQICKENDEFVAVMKNPVIKHEKKFGILKKIFQLRVNKVTFEIFNVLTSKNRESLIYPIAEEFQKLYNLQNGVQKAQVTTTVPLTDLQRTQFEKAVADATNKKVVLEEKINLSLIGGYVLKVNDVQIDTSISKKLKDLKLTFS